MGASSKIGKIVSSREVIYTALIATILVPLLSPIGLPVPISERTIAVYNFIKNLRDNCNVFFDISYSPADRGELEPLAIALSKHLFDKGCRIVYVSLFDTGPLIFAAMRSAAPDVFGKKEYGKDYVFLGFVAGYEAAVASLAKSIKGTLKTDNYGNLLDELPLMKEVDKATDFDVAVIVSSGGDVYPYYVRQWYTPYNIPLIFGPVGVIAPVVEPFVAAKQAVGMIIGQKGAAEYETLIGRKGLATAAMDAQSLTHLLIIVYIIIGNVVYWRQRLSSKMGGERK